eukprot:m.347859 g.347859  ORF g.347859 m.347859 type:complete len:455 (-) comp34438_c0_seq1:68-1432(-)
MKPVTFVLCSQLLVSCNAWGPSPGFPNQLGAKPLHGWRSWQAYLGNVNQTIMENVMEGMAKKRPLGENGESVSLVDIGYVDVGLDSGYENHSGVDGSCHGPDKHMLINRTRFPDFKSMNAKAHALGLTTSWYLNSDGCTGEKEPFVTYEEDANDAVMYGFDGCKFDSEVHGKTRNITLWAQALNATGKEMMIENCLDKNPQYIISDPNHCPFNFYRSGPDNSPDYHSALYHVFHYTVPFLNNKLNGLQSSRPGCFAYPDMLSIGAPVGHLRNEPLSRGCANMTLEEERTLFANWAIVSSPLILAFDVTNDSEVEKYWPIISSKTALKINMAWAGEAGRLLAASNKTFQFQSFDGAACEVSHDGATLPMWLLYSKYIGNGAVAVLAINAANLDISIDITFSALETACSVPSLNSVSMFQGEDVWSGASVGSVTKDKNLVVELSEHSSKFMLFTLS